MPPANAATPTPSLFDEEPRCPFSSDSDEAVFTGLNLVLELKEPAQMPELVQVIKKHEDEIRYKMKRLNSVHFARFLPTRGNTAMQVITEYDGLLEDYLYDFVIEVGDIFNALLGFVKNPPPLPIQENPAAFVAFVRRNNAVTVPPFSPDEVSTFSAYRQKTVLDIIGKTEPPPHETDWWAGFEARRTLEAQACNATDPREAAADDSDIQANILEPLQTTAAVHYALTITDPDKGRQFLERLLPPAGAAATGSPQGIPTVTSLARSRLAPQGPALNVGFTAEGLAALGVPVEVMSHFPQAFREGPVARARANRDVGQSSPGRWLLGRPVPGAGSGEVKPVHLLLTLHGCLPGEAGSADARQAEVDLETAAKALTALWSTCETSEAGVELVHEQPVSLLDDGTFHFGFRDGISQPAIRGHDGRFMATSGVAPAEGNGNPAPDPREISRVGDFILGDGFRNAYGAASLGKLPASIGQNASFAVIRMLEQNVDGFEEMISAPWYVKGNEVPERIDLPKEFVAAKLLGRWRNGMPLTGQGPVTVPEVQEPLPNHFDFRSVEFTDGSDKDDHDGRVCPVHSHVRRMNSRGARAAGIVSAHRIIRRGLPYGRRRNFELLPEQDEAKRGLFGVFYCSDIERQFEFIQQRWGYDHLPRQKTPLDPGMLHASRGEQTQDPYFGAEQPGPGDALCGATGNGAADGPGGGFSFPYRDGKVELQWTQLVTTRGCLYLFVPGLRALAALVTGGAAPADAGNAPLVVTARKTTASGPARATEPMPPGQFERFNPMHPAFIADPYPYYKAFRERMPAARIRHGAEYSQIWVFTHDLVRKVCEDETVFAKPLQGWPRQGNHLKTDRALRVHRGLMYLEGDRHREVRKAVQPQLREAIDGIEQTATLLADQALRQIRDREFDAVPAYVNRVPRDVFMTLFGVPEAQWKTFGELLETMLFAFNPLSTPAERAPYGVASRQLLAEMTRLTPTGAAGGGLFSRLSRITDVQNPTEAMQTCLHFAIGGYLSTAFALGTGIHRLLADPRARKAFDDPLTRRSLIHELLRFEAPFQTVDRRYANSRHDVERRRRAENYGDRFPFELPDDIVVRLGDGQPLVREDEIVTAVLGSALRASPESTGDGDRFMPDRQAPIAWYTSEVFGFGPHHCIGATMVEKVLPIYFERLFAALPTLSLSPTPPVRIPDPAFRGFKSLWLRY